MKPNPKLLTLDANIFIAALKTDEPQSEKCGQILSQIPKKFQLTEPSIIYQEVCGTLARKVTLEVATQAKTQMDQIINPKQLVNCDKTFCAQAYRLCSEFNIYSIDALYLQTALKNNATLVSLDSEDFVERIKTKKPPIEVYSVPEFTI